MGWAKQVTLIIIIIIIYKISTSNDAWMMYECNIINNIQIPHFLHFFSDNNIVSCLTSTQINGLNIISLLK